MNEDIKALCVRLETVANESEKGLNFAGTPEICRQAVLAISGGTLFNERLEEENRLLRKGMDDLDKLLQRVHAECQPKPALQQISTYGAIDQGYEPTGEAQ